MGTLDHFLVTVLSVQLLALQCFGEDQVIHDRAVTPSRAVNTDVQEDVRKPVQHNKNLSHIPNELLKFGLSGLLQPKDRKELDSCDPEIRIRATSLEGVPSRDIVEQIKLPVLASFDGKISLDLGGGYSKLLPYMREAGVQAFSLDPTYDKGGRPQGSVSIKSASPELKAELGRMEKEVLEYKRKNQQWLIVGRAEDLSKVTYLRDAEPRSLKAIEDGSIDLITSSHTWGYLGRDPFAALLIKSEVERARVEEQSKVAQVQGLREVVRVLKSGATARIDGVSADVLDRFLRAAPPAATGYEYAIAESVLPRDCNAILDTGYHIDGKKPYRFIVLFKK